MIGWLQIKEGIVRKYFVFVFVVASRFVQRFVRVFVSIFVYQISWKAEERKEVSIRESGANLQGRHLSTDFIFVNKTKITIQKYCQYNTVKYLIFDSI